MAIRNILTYPDKFLRQTAKPVTAFNDDLQVLIDDMIETMYDEPGVGLAAVQIGSDLSVIVYDVTQTEGERRAEALVNPKIVFREGSVLSENEGCLSVPDFRSDVKRDAHIRVEGLDRHGNPVDIDADEFLAIVLQHEIDHLNGVLFIDRISSLKREMYKRKRKKQLRQQT
ncbi:MAG: peptide deformylase [Desulfobacteraceae bacterium]|nr:peptide deformylase [Desulfobacteraceae bacterium]MBC2748978.1 peptide deformylase [Desulfobacteraceae bacterium]